MRIKVIGVGNCVSDQHPSGDKTYGGRQATNFAAYAKKLGADASYLGVVQGDAVGARVKRELLALGVGMERCRDLPDHGDGGRAFDAARANDTGKAPAIVLEKEDLTYLKAFDLVHVDLDGLAEAELEKINRCRVPISFDFSARRSQAYFRGVCPYVEYGFVSCGDLSQRSMDEKMNQLFQFGCKRIIALHGGREAVYFDGREKLQYRLPHAKLTDAEDAFPAGFMICYLTWQKAVKERMISETEQEDAVFRAMEAGAMAYELK